MKAILSLYSTTFVEGIVNGPQLGAIRLQAPVK
jgi:hypothetical protein